MRFPFAPVVEICRGRYRQPNESPGSVPGPTEWVTSQTGLSRNTVWHYRFGLSVTQADRVACRLGLHPAEIWPDWFDTAPKE